MSGIEAAAMIFLFIAFATGVLTGVVAIASFAYNREDRRGSLTGRAPGAVSQGARRLTGVGTIGPAGWTVPGRRTGDEGDEDARRTEAWR